MKTLFRLLALIVRPDRSHDLFFAESTSLHSVVLSSPSSGYSR